MSGTKRAVKNSYGLICCRYNSNNDQIETLMVHKRTTFSFVDFVLGRYKRNDRDRILFLLNRMTSEEKIDIFSLDFGRIWYRIWLQNPDMLDIGKDKKEKYAACKKFFDNNFVKDKGALLISLLNSTNNSVETLWEPPKGRLASLHEKPLNCAVREFYEETGITPLDYEIVEFTPYKTSIENGKIKYVNHYYVAVLHHNSKYNNSRHLKINYGDALHVTEVIGMQWMSLHKISVMDPGNRFHGAIRDIITTLRKKHKIRFMSMQKLI
jgi:8-oxo-dGTP pyrophosphatase MutT (NUDIX family)